MEREHNFPSIISLLNLSEEVAFVFSEYKRLKKENTELRNNLYKQYNNIIDMANKSQESVDSFVNAILSGEISLDGKKHKDCGIKVKGVKIAHVGQQET